MRTPSLSDLTPREREVLHWLAEGKTSSETAMILHCAQETVKKHRYRIYRSLGVEGAVSAASIYWATMATPVAAA